MSADRDQKLFEDKDIYILGRVPFGYVNQGQFIPMLLEIRRRFIQWL